MVVVQLLFPLVYIYFFAIILCKNQVFYSLYLFTATGHQLYKSEIDVRLHDNCTITWLYFTCECDGRFMLAVIRMEIS